MRTFILREQRNLDVLNAYLKGWEDAAKAGKAWQVSIGPEKAKRSLTANRFYWALLQQISDQAWIEGRQYASAVYHELLKRRFIGCIDLPGGGMLGMSTSDLSQKEFAEYVDKCTVWAAQELGVTFTEPEP